MWTINAAQMAVARGRVARQTALVDERLAALSERVAAAADAWLVDPQDTGVYARLVRAIRERRVYLHPTLDTTAAADGETTPSDESMREVESPLVTPPHDQADEVLDGLADRHPVHPLSEALAGADPREMLARLRSSDR